MTDASHLAIRKIDILDQPAEALIYSTNVELNGSGGVGAALIRRYGTRVQDTLDELRGGKPRVPQGSVFERPLTGTPYRAIFHTVPTGRWHETTPEKVAQVLERALKGCIERGIQTVALSALATGYGDLLLEEFLVLTDRVAHLPAFQTIREVTLCLDDPTAFTLAIKVIQARKLGFRRA